MKVIITGATGMVGKGVLLECLKHDSVKQVLLVNRAPIDIKHPKIREIILADFTDFNSIQREFNGYDACFHCMGVSSAGITHEQYYKFTYTITDSLVNAVYNANPNSTFIYVSGAGTDGTEKSRTMWANVKGKTENLIFSKGFKNAYAFRPGIILPQNGIKSRTKLYNFFYTVTRPIFPILQRINSVTSTQNIGKAMIHLTDNPKKIKIFSGSEINRLTTSN